MFKLKSTRYFILLISSLLLSMICLNVFLNYKTGNLKLTFVHTGAISAIPPTSLSPQYTVIITLAVIVAGYFLWVWHEADKLKNKK